MNLHLLIANWLRAHRFGGVMLSPFDVVFTEFDVLEPDLLYLSNERAGVSEYWVVDPELDVVRIRRTGEAGFEKAAELSREAGDVLSTSLLPGLDLPLALIFEE